MDNAPEGRRPGQTALLPSARARGLREPAPRRNLGVCIWCERAQAFEILGQTVWVTRRDTPADCAHETLDER